MSGYTHDPNLRNLYWTLQYNPNGEPEMRVAARIGDTVNVSVTNTDPIPVTLGSNTITITGNVNVGTSVEINNTSTNPVPERITAVGTSGNLQVPYLPIGGEVSVDQNTFPWIIQGNVNVSTMPTVTVGNFPSIQAVTGNVNAVVSGSITANQGTSPWIVTSTNAQPVYSTPADGPNISVFNRQRHTGARLLGEFRTYYGTTGNAEIITNAVNGGSYAVNLVQKLVTLSVNTTTNSQVVRQSRQYHPYIPGSGNIGLISFVFGQGKTNLQQLVGMYDDNNGIFLRMNGITPEVVIRQGGIDVEVYQQSVWNVDTMTGTGPSGIAIDFTKAQILVIDYQWLGVGRARIGFDINGQIFYVHYFNHANNVTVPYMYEASLPARWEIKNIGTTASNSTMTAICYGVYCEGSDYETGFQNSAANGTTPIAINTSPGGIGMLAVRLRNSVNGVPVKALARLKNWSIISNSDMFYKLLILQDSSAISGTPVWTPATPIGWCEYTTNFTLTSDPGTNSIVLYQGYASGNTGNTGSIAAVVTDERSASIYQNYDSTNSMIIAIIGYKLANNATAYASMDWIEIK